MNQQQQRNKGSQPKVVRAKQQKKKSAKKNAQFSNQKGLQSDWNTSPLSQPLAMTRIRRTAAPRLQNVGQRGDIIVTHREYISDIIGSVAFHVNKFPVNPGMASTFPWLSAIAHRFERYRFEALRFDYNVGINATTANGFVMLANEYDASDPDPISKVQLLSYRGAVECVPYRECAMISLPEDLHALPTFKVRRSALGANSDITTFDTANFYVCTQSQADSTTMVGSLLVSYTVRLMTPQLDDPTIGDALGGLFSGVSNAAPFATNASTLPAAVVSSGTTTSVSTWTFTSPWQGYVTLGFIGTGITAPVATGTAATITTQDTVTLASGLSTMQLLLVDALAGQTLVITEGNTTVSNSLAAFGQADS